MTQKHWRYFAGSAALALSSLHGAAADGPDLPPAPPQLGHAPNVPTTHLPDAPVAGGSLAATLPAQSMTLYVIPHAR